MSQNPTPPPPQHLSIHPDHPNHTFASSIFHCLPLPSNHPATSSTSASASHTPSTIGLHGPLTRYDIGHYDNFQLGSSAMDHFLTWCDHLSVPMPAPSSYDLAGGGDTYLFEAIHYKAATVSRGEPATLATPRYFVRDEERGYVELHNYVLGCHRVAGLKLKKQVVLRCELDHGDGDVDEVRGWEVNMLGTDC